MKNASDMMVESPIVTGITLRHRTVGIGSAAGTTSEHCVPAVCRLSGSMFSSVELPGIEPATKINLTWGNAEFGWRETTCEYSVDDINTVGAPVNRAANGQSYLAEAEAAQQISFPRRLRRQAARGRPGSSAGCDA